MRQEGGRAVYAMTDDGWRLGIGREGGRTITATGLPLSVRGISLLRTVVVENEALNASFFSLFRGPDRRLPLDEGEPVEIAIDQDARDVPDRKRRTYSACCAAHSTSRCR